MTAELTPQLAELPNYTAEDFRGYAPILRETLAVLDAKAPPMAIDLPRKTQDDLQWHDLKDALARHCVGPEASTTAERLPPLLHRESIERRLCEVEEAVRLLVTDLAPPLQGLDAVGRYLDHANRGGMLEGPHLLAVARVARVAANVRSFFASRRHLAPLLAQPAEDLETAPGLVQALEHAFDPAGKLADHASPDLGELRRRVENYHARLKHRLESYLRDHDFKTFLQDDYFTQRNDRYVLPVRAGDKGNVPGIVHGTSGSGQTIYIEPTALVELNNDLQLAQMEVAEEERRILLRLSGLVAAESRKLAGNQLLLAYIDLTVAKARLALELTAHRPELSLREELDLRQARHPMLVLKALHGEKPFEVVANDIHLGLPAPEADGVADETRQQILVISGPNTGGKTVTLKTIGLSCLMARAGLHIPAHPGSVVPLVDEIFSDIGDEQSIERDLSTFSGHVANINSFIKRVGPRSLVLLDELFAGTDPEQGVALATALLEDMADRGARVAVTTHLESLKTLAFNARRFANASVGFDVASLAPTYRLSMGLPGSSYAIRIARRLGMPQTIVERAEKVADHVGAAEIEKIIQQLEDERERLEKETRRAAALRRDAEKLQRQYEQKLESIREREMGMIHKETRKLMEEVETVRELLRRHTRALQETNAPADLTHKAIEDIRQEVEQAAASVTAKRQEREAEAIREARRPVADQQLEVGDRVWVKTFKRPGELVEIQHDRKRAVVQVGGIKATVTLDELFSTRPEEEPATKGKKGHALPLAASGGDPAPDPTGRVIPPQTSTNTVDLRGMRVDEAIERMELFLDAAYRSREPGIYIIHGHGTGALKSAVRAFLPSSRYVGGYRPGERGEGGDGVTVAHIV